MYSLPRETKMSSAAAHSFSVFINATEVYVKAILERMVDMQIYIIRLPSGIYSFATIGEENSGSTREYSLMDANVILRDTVLLRHVFDSVQFLYNNAQEDLADYKIR